MTPFIKLHSAFSKVLIAFILCIVSVHCFSQKNLSNQEPAMTGATPLGQPSIQEFSWLDPSRNRLVLAKLYWPNHSLLKSSHKKIPLVIFSHGIWGSKDDYSYIGNYLAENSIACLHLQHTGSDSSVWKASFWQMPKLLYLSTRDEEAIHRAKDFQFALSQVLLTTNYSEKIDLNSIVAAGHSFGANTTMLVSGAIVKNNRKDLNWSDPRVKMAVIISAPPFYGNDDEETQKILSGIKIPSLHITTSNDKIRVPGFRSPPQDRIKIFDSMKNSAKNLVVFNDGPHGIFTDNAKSVDAQLSKKIKGASQQIILSFIQSQGNPQELEKNQSIQNWRLQHSTILERTEWSFLKNASAQK